MELEDGNNICDCNRYCFVIGNLGYRVIKTGGIMNSIEARGLAEIVKSRVDDIWPGNPVGGGYP